MSSFAALLPMQEARALASCAGWHASVAELTDIDAPYQGSVQLVPDYAQSNAEFMRQQEVCHCTLTA